MKNNRIRLTESQLHNVIRESVKQVLSELDWKTYDSAMRKAAKKGEWHRVGKFGDAATKAFNRDFGSKNWSEDYNYHRSSGPYTQSFDNYTYEPTDGTISHGGFYTDRVAALRYDGDDECGTYTGITDFQHRRTPDGKFHTNMGTIDKYADNDDYNFNDLDSDIYYRNSEGEGDGGRDVAMQAARKGAKETRSYLNGEYEYKKGKGWQKKDGLDESIRKAIKKVLH